MGRHGNTFCPRRAAKNGNCNFLLSTKGREGPRRTATATATPFCPRRAAKGREERQRQLPFVHEGPRRTTKNGNCNCNSFCPRRAAKGREERQRQHPFVHEGPRRTTKNGNCNTFCPRRATRGRGELPFDPRSARGEWRGVRRERTLGPSQSGGAGTVAGALRFLVAG